MNTDNPEVEVRNRAKKRKINGAASRAGRKEYSGSRWAGLILLVISFIISLIFYARSGAADFLSSLFGPAKYTIQK